MKTMKFLARRISALVLVATVGLTALVPAAFAAPASLPDLPKDQCVVDDANVLSSSTVQTIQDLNTQLQGCSNRRADRGLHGQRLHGGLCRGGRQHLGPGQQL